MEVRVYVCTCVCVYVRIWRRLGTFIARLEARGMFCVRCVKCRCACMCVCVRMDVCVFMEVGACFGIYVCM